MAIDRIYQFDPSGPASNSNFASIPLSENAMAPSHVNNAFRQLALILAHEFHLPPASLSASVSTNVVTSTVGQHCIILGAGAINSLGTVPGEHPDSTILRILEFSSSASLSHGTALRLIGGQSRRTQPGDIGGYLHVGSGDAWVEFLYSRADGALAADSISVTTITNRSMSTSAVSTVTLNAASASVTNIAFTSLNTNSISASVGEFTLLSASGRPAIVFHGRATNATYATLGTIIPHDNTIPQNTEGDEILSLTVTPTNAASILRIRAFLNIGGGSDDQVGAALFVDSTAGAIAASSGVIGISVSMDQMELLHYVSASSTTQRVYHLRAGAGAATDAFLNGDATARVYGGVAVSYLEVEEILP